MAKQRPSRTKPAIETSIDSTDRTKESQRYWSQRIYRASYTRTGVSHRVRHWSVKIQHQGIRRSISLSTSSKPLAAQRALKIYQAIIQLGWQGAEPFIEHFHDTPQPQSSLLTSPKKGTRTASFWKQRLSRRSYLGEAGLGESEQWSVRIEREGINDFFPTGSKSAEKAIRFARTLSSLIEKEGWRAVCRRYSREFTIAIFWSTDPLTCTYATMLSLVENDLKSFSKRRGPTRKVVIVEPNPEIANTIQFGISQNPGFTVLGTAENAEQAKTIDEFDRCDLLLINRQRHAFHTLPKDLGNARHPSGMVVVGYGIYEDSNQIFRSVSGVNRGYFLRRRNPDQLLAPITTKSPEYPFKKIAPLTVTAYYMQLFAEISHSEPSSQLSLLTRRELEILEQLSAGSLDKEIAVRLRISNWTVRNHLKRIYSKLKIHNRTEAVIQYLQK